MAVLLIGSTGMGKSAFGNYLLDPDKQHIFNNQTFAVATDNTPMTQEVKVASKKVQINHDSMQLTIIDTPGLNESPKKDLSHMIDIIKQLRECKEIRACILVVKFNAKIDAQYKATIEYYSRLLPGLFERNVIIVMTEFKTDKSSEEEREIKNTDVEQIKRNTILELGKSSKKELTYSPQLFMIDCQPLGETTEINRQLRSAILDYIKKLTPVKIENPMVAKTAHIKQIDAAKCDALNTKINEYKENIQEISTNSKDALDETQKIETNISNIEIEVKKLEKSLSIIDTTDEVVAEHWSIEEKWKVLRWFTREIIIFSPYEISDYMTWSNGKCEFKEIVQTSHEVRGKVTGNFMRGIYASVTAYTEKRIKYASEIQDLKSKIEREETKLRQCKAEQEDFRKKHQKESGEITKLKNFIKDQSAALVKFNSETMTLEEAMSRLEEL